ncbi:MAG: hypothetical protein AAGA75_03955 [Cyanobacteria bacterium P01_E01_bin.6]
MSLIYKAIPQIASITTAARSSQGVRSWATLSGLLLALCLWNWTMALAMAIAIVSGIALYLAQERRLTLKWLRRSRAWKHHQSLWISLSVSSGVFVGTYGLARIWQESNTPWFTMAIILQSIGALAAIGFLVWDKAHGRAQITHPNGISRKRSVHELLNDLTHDNAVARLVAVRAIAGQVMAPDAQNNVDSLNTHASGASVWTASDILPCFQLMRKHELEPIVQKAIDDAVNQLNAFERRQLGKFHSYPQSLMTTPVRTIPNLLRTRTKRVKTLEPLGVEMKSGMS